jgi:hypothetical protein
MMRWVLVLTVLGTSAGACGDDDNSGQLADAPPSSDARLVDAPPGDAAADAAPDAGPVGVIVTVTLGGVPSPGQTVYFQSRDSVTTETVLTGADGNATAIVEAGGYVTVVKPEPPEEVPTAIGPRAHLSTFAGVQPGDHLFVDVPIEVEGPASVSFTINTPNEEQSREYNLHTTCGSAFIGRGDPPDGINRRARRARRVAGEGTTVSTTVELVGCGGMADMLVISSDGKGGPRGWIYRANVPVTAEGTVDFVGEYAELEEQTFTYTMSPETRRISARRELRTARGALYSDGTDRFLESTTESFSLRMPTPPDVVAVTTSTALLANGFSRTNVLDWGANNSSYELDFTAVGLHPYSGEPSYDVPRHEIVWTEGDGKAAQFTIASLRTTRSDDEVSNTWTWDLVTPWDSQKLAYPRLPTTLFDFSPRADDEISVQRLTTAQVPGGYNAARPRVFIDDPEGTVVGPTGRVVFEELFFGSDEARKIPIVSTKATTAATKATKATTFRRGGFPRHAR